MRAIKFRGKRIDNNEWAYGNLITQLSGEGEIKKTFINNPISGIACDNGYPLASMIVVVEVYPDSVGQCTGLKDNSGREIYEGEIILDKEEWYHPSAVVFENGEYITPDNGETLTDTVRRYSVKIIGNVFENLELLE